VLNQPAAKMHNHLRLLTFARSHRAALALIFVLTAAASGLVALQPWPIKFLIDYALDSHPLPGWLDDFFRSLSLEPTRGVLLVAAVVGGLMLFALSSALDSALAGIWTMAGRRIVYDVAEIVFARLQRLSLTFHKHTSVGDLMGRVTVDGW